MNEHNDNFDILVIEDSRTIALQLQIILERQGLQAVVTGNGFEALQLLQKRPFPIVITDWVMPQMDGCQFCRAIRRQSFDYYIYIILQTTKDSKEDIIAGLKAGADDYIIKPIDPAELLARLNTARRIISLEQSLKKHNEEIMLLSITDLMTNVFNRRYLNKQLASSLNYAFRYNHPLSIIMYDIDHFKNINDQYGHQAGDMVLKRFADCLKKNLRQDADWVARYGGEEFIIVLPETTLDNALIVAERKRQEISEMVIESERGLIKITASFGAASVLPSKEGKPISMECIVGEADRSLYKAKAEGRNRGSGSLLKS